MEVRIPLEEGQTPEEAKFAFKQRLMNDPKMRERYFLRKQIRDDGGFDVASPDGRNAEIAKRIAAPVEESPFTLSPITSVDIGLSNEESEILAKLEKAEPDVEFRSVDDPNGSGLRFFARFKDMRDGTHFQPINPPGMDIQSILETGGALIKPAAEFGGALLGGRGLAKAAEGVPALGRAAGRKAFDIFGTSAAEAGGAVGGGAAVEGIEALRGFQDTSLGEIGEEAGLIGGLTFAAGALTRSIISGVNAARSITIPESQVGKAREAQTFLRSQGREGPFAGEVNEFMRRAQDLAAGTSQTAKNAITERFTDIVDLTRIEIKKLTDAGVVDLTDARIISVLDKQAETYIQTLRATIGKGDIGAKAMADTMTEMDNALALRTVLKFQKALADGRTKPLDLTEAQAMIRDIKEGFMPVISQSKTGAKAPLFSRGEESGELIELFANPDSASGIGQAIKLIEDMGSTIRLRRAVTPGGDPVESGALAQMLEVRKRLFNLASNPELPNAERQAASALHDVFQGLAKDQPSLQAAFNAHSFQQKALVSAGFRSDFQNMTAAELGRTYSNPFMLSRLDVPMMRRLLSIKTPLTVRTSRPGVEITTAKAPPPSEAFNEFRGGILNEYLSSPSTLGTTLKKFASPFLKDVKKMLFRGNQFEDFETYAVNMKELKNSKISKLMESQDDVGRRGMDLAQSGSLHDINAYLLNSTGKTGQAALATPEGRLIQRSILETMLDASTDIVKGVPVINQSRFLAQFKKMRQQSKLDNLLEPHVLKQMEQIENATSFLPARLDTGSSIAATEAVSASLPGPVQILNPLRAIGGFSTIGRNRLLAALMVNRRAQNFFIRRGRAGARDPVSPERVKNLALATTFVTAELSRDVRSIAQRSAQEDKDIIEEMKDTKRFPAEQMREGESPDSGPSLLPFLGGR